MAAVVVNCPPFRGALTACHSDRCSEELAATGASCATSPIAVPVRRSHGFALDNPPRRCAPTSGATAIPFHILVRDDPLEKLRGRIISGRLGLLIRNIKPKRQRTFISSQPSPSAAKSLFVFNPLGI
jgi:hypothetical protein